MKRVLNTFCLFLVAALAVKCASLTTFEFTIDDNTVFQLGSNDQTTEVVEQPAESSDFKLVTIPFYYDHTNAPANLSQESVLSAINIASLSWERACNVSFKYMGHRQADYVDMNKKYSKKEGIIYWGQLSEDAIGEAQMGSSAGPAFGFVLGLEPNFFANRQSQAFLTATIMHELGHVIGLEHSNNSKSIMYSEQRESQVKLNQADIAMCKYLRARWTGLNASEAAEKYGVVTPEE